MPQKVAFLGPDATFTHQAAIKLYPKENHVAERSIQSVFHRVEFGDAHAGVVPVENSTEGSVSATFDLLAESSLQITGETSLAIAHFLLSKEKSLADIRTVHSHPQALAQCANWLERNLPKAELVEAQSTALAAQTASQTPHAASISSELASKHFSIPVLERNIQDNPQNRTRFLSIGKTAGARGARNKTSLFFTVAHKPGALFDALAVFKIFDINMTKIESRPSKRNPWEYVFFVDIEGHKDDDRVQKTLSEMAHHTVHLRVLGSFGVTP